MEIVFNPIDEKDLYNCFDYGIINILLHYKQNFEYVLSDSMNISLSDEAIGGCFRVNKRNFFLNSNFYNLSEQYFGIKFKKVKADNVTNVFDYVKQELFQNHIVLINIDLYYDIARNDYYKKVHCVDHCRIVTGIIDDNVVLYNWNERYLIPCQDFVNGTYEVITYSINQDFEKINGSFAKITLRNSLESLLDIYIAEEWINNLKKWERSFEQLDFPSVFNNSAIILTYPLFGDIRVLIRSRKRYKIYMEKCLLGFEKESDKDKYNIVIDKLASITMKYQLMKNLLLKEEKVYIQNNYVDRSIIIINNLKRLMDEAIILEKEFLGIIKKLY
ncbi:MAG: hypothetical protein HFG39_10300 [Lachnospiraceae bacterium]|nr:hypothetical protein [Lachnospiraceae bacterium]